MILAEQNVITEIIENPLTLDEVLEKAESLVVDTVDIYIPKSYYLWNI